MADEKTRNLFLQEVAKIDSQIMDLTSELVKQLQKAVDLDQQLYGNISEITQQFLNTYHYKVVNGIVVVEDYHVPETNTITQNNTLPEDNKRMINQSQLDELMAEHQEKQKAGNYEMLDLSNCKFENIEFTGDYSLVNFRGSEFTGCKFNNANIEDAILEKAEIYKSDISTSVFENCNFTNSTLAYVKANDSTFRECQFDKAAYVASQLSFIKFHKCNFENNVIHETSFSHNITQDCYIDRDSIDISENNETYREKFSDAFYGNTYYEYEIDRASADHHYKINIQTYIDDERVTSEDVIVNYDLASDTLNISENDISAKAALSMLKTDFKKDIQEYEFKEYADLFENRPRVMVNRTNSLIFREGQMYNFSEFASRLASDNPENASAWVDFSLKFTVEEGGYLPQRYDDKISLTEKGMNIVEHLAESQFFSPDEIKYLEEYAQNKSIPQSQEQKLNQAKEVNAEAEAHTHNTTGEKNENKLIDRPYQAFAYVNSKETQKPVRVTSNTPEEIIKMLQEWNQERTDDNQLAVCYIRQNNTDAKDYIKYEIKTGADITPIYLKLPPMGREKFTALVADIKSKGAKYNPTQKAFYVTKQNDLSLFSEYIPDASQMSPESRTGSKSSVIDKLNNNKNKVNSENHTQHKQQHRNNEVPMIS